MWLSSRVALRELRATRCTPSPVARWFPPFMSVTGVSTILIGDIPSGQDHINWISRSVDSTQDFAHEQPRPGDWLRQRRPFYRPLFDADLRRRRDRDGTGARHGL